MKKIFGFLISLIVLVTLTACDGGNTVVEATPTPPAELVITEPTPEPPAPTEEVIEEPTPEPEPIEEPTPEPEPAEPSDEEIIAEVLANDEYYEDGAFCPKLYAEAIGYKWYGDYSGEADFSVTVDGIEYFFYLKASNASYNFGYTDGNGKCFGLSVFDVEELDRNTVIKFKTGDKANFNSDTYVNSVISVMTRVSKTGAADMNSWEIEGLSYNYCEYNCEPVFFEDGFIDVGKLTNMDEEKSFSYDYKDN